MRPGPVLVGVLSRDVGRGDIVREGEGVMETVPARIVRRACYPKTSAEKDAVWQVLAVSCVSSSLPLITSAG
jgi:hypothetical protein